MNLYFTFELRNCLDLFSAPIDLKTCSSYVGNASVQFHIKIRKISFVACVLQNTQSLVISRCCCTEDGKEMFKDTCTATVLVIKTFALWGSRCRCRRSLLKIFDTTSCTWCNIFNNTPKNYRVKNLFLLFPLICYNYFLLLFFWPLFSTAGIINLCSNYSVIVVIVM